MAHMRIFLSHSSADKDFADALARALRNAGANVWYDETHLGTGQLLREISKQLADRPVFIVVLSKDAFASHWVPRECEWAYDLYHNESGRTILPIVAERISMSDWHSMLWLREFRRISRAGGEPFPHDEAISITLRLLKLTTESASALTVNNNFNPWANLSASLRAELDVDDSTDSVISLYGAGEGEATREWKADEYAEEPEVTVPPTGGFASSQTSQQQSMNKEIRSTHSSQPSRPAEPLDIVCSNCGVRNAPGRVTCKNCGESIKPLHL